MTSPSQLDYRVQLDAYSGPLDLLLYLVKRDEIDLHDIPIARLTDQYLQHLELLKQIDIDLAGDFLVMAATLLEIKSAMLVPPGSSPPGSSESTAEDTSGGGPIIDPRMELVQQLLAYKRFKDAANELEDRFEDWQSRFAHAPAREASATDDAAQPLEIDLEDVHVLDLCEAFARILASVGQGPGRHEVVYDDTPIALHAEDIVDRLTREGPMTLQRIFVGRTTRAEMIGLFLAMLELTRQRKVRIIQDRVAGEIRLELRPESEWGDALDEKPADWRDPATGEVLYDWPSEEARLRAEKRAALRIARAKGQPPAEEDTPFNVTDDEPLDESGSDEAQPA